MARIGTHVSVAGGLDKAFARADALGCESMQIFTRSQRQWQSKPVSLQEAEDFYRAWQRSSVETVVSHASYLINIGSSDAEMLEKSRRALREEAERCHQLGITDIVLHPGFAKEATADEAIENIAASLRQLFEDTPDFRARVLLETMAGQGTVIGADFAHFSQIGELLDWPPRLAFCVDTCHVFAAGYDLRSAEAYERFISLIDRHVGTDNVLCWHLNDSKAARGSRLDRHAHLGDGEIGLHPFALLMNDVRFENIPTILETPKEGVGDEGNLSFLRKVRGG
ncbi:deoxyribonuclease IV [Cloacibacillus evryensis]|uniref:deoxyribonuclease IV n=1 Tax=Cloacibacillus evryensis TaxID=508460 RepID=UPI00210D11D9|nr:deoxyribonuclease IV [Cloacibacillus evryensis]MCQ4763185.1 deoxyribonuclease IV [Cloacibacillus evryensis]